MKLALFLALGLACSKQSPQSESWPAVGAADLTCKTDADCTIRLHGCCTGCGDGNGVVVNQARASRDDEARPKLCSGAKCPDISCASPLCWDEDEAFCNAGQCAKRTVKRGDCGSAAAAAAQPAQTKPHDALRPCARWDGKGDFTLTLLSQDYGLVPDPLERFQITSDGRAIAATEADSDDKFIEQPPLVVPAAKLRALRRALAAVDFNQFPSTRAGYGEGSNLRRIELVTASGDCSRSFINKFPPALAPVLQIVTGLKKT